MDAAQTAAQDATERSNRVRAQQQVTAEQQERLAAKEASEAEQALKNSEEARRRAEEERLLDGKAHPPPSDGLLTIEVVGCAGLIAVGAGQGSDLTGCNAACVWEH